jgi:hypothetical protein
MEATLNNNKELKEPLMSDLSSTLTVDNVESKDYKEVIAEIADKQEEERERRYHDIKNMDMGKLPEARRKAIASMLYFDIPAFLIMTLLRVPMTTFYRYINK